MPMTIRLSGALLQALAPVILLAPALNAQARSSAVPNGLERLLSEARASEASGDVRTAISRYQKVVQSAPRLVAAWNNLGALLLQDRQLTAANEALQQASRLKPHSARTELLLGTGAYESGDLAAAEKFLKMSLADASHTYHEVSPQDALDTRQASDLLVTVLLRQGREEDAAGLLQARIRQDRRDQEALYRLGKLYLALSQRELISAREVAPDSALAHMMQGEFEETLGNVSVASSEYQTAAQLEPQRAGVHDHLGSLFWTQGQWEPARQEFLEELRSNGLNCSVRWKIGNTYLQERQSFEIALGYLNDALQQCPDLNQARVDRAEVLILIDRPDQAIGDLKTALRTDPQEASIHFWLSKAYRQTGHTDQAAAEMQTFSDLNATAQKVALPPASH